MRILLSATADHATSTSSPRALLFCGLLTLSLMPLAAMAKPVSDLYNRVPLPPASVRDALHWVGSDDKIIEPGVLAYQTELEHESHATLTATVQAAQNTVGNGIDVARLQSDPAYQQQLAAQAQAQALQYQNMSQQQMIAAGMAQAAQSQNAMRKDASKTMQESPAVTQAIAAMRQTQIQWQLHPKTPLQASLDTSSATLTQRYKLRREALEKQYPGHDGDCGDCSDAQVAKIKAISRNYWREILALENQWLGETRSAFTQARTASAAIIAEGEKELTLVQYGAAVQSQMNRQVIGSYQAHLLTESQALLDYSEAAARHAASVAAEAKLRAQLDP